MALRSTRQVPNVYFGIPGKLVTLPWPASGMDKPYDRQTSDFLTGSGMHQTSTLVLGSRPYEIAWDALHIDNFIKLSQFRIGVNGAGPFVLIDPSSPNLLDANVSAPTAVTGFTSQSFISVSGANGTITHNSNSAFVHRSLGWASLKWAWSVTPATTPQLFVQSPSRAWYSYPCVPTLSYAFSSWVTVDGTVETNATVAVKINWLNASGGVISTSAGSATAVTGWTKLSVIGTAPAGAVYMQPFWELTGSTMVSGGALYIDEVMLEQDTVVNDWAPGTGIKPVEILGLSEKVPFDTRFRTNVTLSLRELAP